MKVMHANLMRAALAIAALALAGGEARAQSLTPLGGIDLPGTETKIAVDGSTAILLNEVDDEVIIVDVSNPLTPASVGTYSEDSGYDVFSIGLSGSLAFIGVENVGVRIVDISNPASPQPVGLVDGGNPGSIAVSGTTLFVADSILASYDVSNPASPVLLSQWLIGGTSLIALGGDRMVATLGSDDLAVFDVSTPGSIALAGYLRSAISDPSDVAVAGLEGSIVAVSQGRAGEFDRTNGIQFFHLSQSSVPKLSGAIYTRTPMLGVEAAGYIVFAANGIAGIKAIDVTFPPLPVVVASYTHSSGEARDLAVKGGLIYVANGTTGFFILQTQGVSLTQTESWTKYR